MGDYLPFLYFGSGVTVTKLALPEYHSIILSDIGRLKAYGGNGSGQVLYN